MDKEWTAQDEEAFTFLTKLSSRCDLTDKEESALAALVAKRELTDVEENKSDGEWMA